MDLDLIEERASRRGYKVVRTDWNERGDRGYLKVWAQGVVRTFTAGGVVWPEGLDNADLLGERTTWKKLQNEGFPGWECDHGAILDDELNFVRGIHHLRAIQMESGRVKWSLLFYTPAENEPARDFDLQGWEACRELACVLAEVKQ